MFKQIQISMWVWIEWWHIVYVCLLSLCSRMGKGDEEFDTVEFLCKTTCQNRKNLVKVSLYMVGCVVPQHQNRTHLCFVPFGSGDTLLICFMYTFPCFTTNPSNGFSVSKDLWSFDHSLTRCVIRLVGYPSCMHRLGYKTSSSQGKCNSIAEFP